MYLPRQAQLPAAHRVHAEKTKLACVDCHTNATTSDSANDWLGPSKERCIECHGQRFEGVAMAPPPSPRVRLSHARHAARGIDCAACHGRVNERDDARGSEQLPLMARLPGVPQRPKGRQRPSRERLPAVSRSRGGVIQTRFREGLLVPSNSLGPVEHTGNWLYAARGCRDESGPAVPFVPQGTRVLCVPQ